MQREDYEVLELVGRGSFGQIHKVRRKRDGHILARKGISYLRMSTKEKEQLVNEFNILSKLSHPNIVQYYHRDHDKAEQSLYIYMEYCGGGDLSSRIKACRAEGTLVPEAVVWTIFTQIVLALHRCHNGAEAPPVTEIFDKREKRRVSSAVMGGAAVNKEIILHRDLKPENVFLDHDNAVKLGDFGLSRILTSEHHLATTYVGTPYYMSPEIVCDLPYTSRSDIWSLGCLIYELCSLTPPFNAKSHLGLCQKIKEGRYAPLPAQYSTELKRVVDSCLRVNPSERPDTGRLLDLDIMRLCRKELEATEVGRLLKLKDETLKKKERELDTREKAMAQQLETMVSQMRSKLTIEFQTSWEMKAEAEIRRRVDMESKQLFENYKAKYEAEMDTRFQEALREQIEKLQNCKPVQQNIPSETFDSLSLTVPSGNKGRSTSPDAPLVPEIPKAQMTQAFKAPAPPAGKVNHIPPPSPMDISMSSPMPTPRYAQRNVTQGSPLQRRTNLSKMVRCHSAAVGFRSAAVADDSSSDEDEEFLRPTMNQPPPPRPFPMVNMKSAPILSQALDLQSAVQHRAKRPKQHPGLKQFQQRDGPLSSSNTASENTKLTSFPWGGEQFQQQQFGSKVNMINNTKAKPKSLAELHKESKMRNLGSGELNKENELSAAPVWNPDVDEMPSPFLSRRRVIM